MTDLKNYGLNNRRDKLLDDLATGLAWAVATLLLLLYGLGAVPARADQPANPAIPKAIADALVVSCAKFQSVEKAGERYFIACTDVVGRPKTFIFRVDRAGLVYIEPTS